ncbi:MAG: HTH domain-containing protein, partial [Clostridia bacterium]|nr:HTH domain-containing protein [Clostridia bacterium]
VLTDYLGGMSYEAIAEKTGRSRKSVDNALQRIKKKVAELIAEER